MLLLKLSSVSLRTFTRNFIFCMKQDTIYFFVKGTNKCGTDKTNVVSILSFTRPNSKVFAIYAFEIHVVFCEKEKIRYHTHEK